MLSYQDFASLVSEHEAWRARCLNLIAAENALSPAVRRFLDGDLVQRYGNYAGRNLTDRRYTGNRYVQRIEVGLLEIVREVFGASEVELRAISGHVAGLAVIMATCRPGDTVLELAGIDGGHRLAEKAAESPLIDLKVLPLPFDPINYNVNAEAACQLIAERKPSLVILGASNFLFPHPVKEIAASLAASPRTVLAYDASHVLGLIACGEFQSPLPEGAHVVFGSTHKTLPGPQGGLIFSNDARLMDAISTAVYPGTVTNHHLMRSPALGVALLEMHANKGYARQIIRNAQTLGKSLSEQGLRVVAAHRGFTQSHTILLQVAEYGTGRSVAALLEEAEIMTSYASLPDALGKEGVRLGTAEVTRLGARETDMASAAEIIADVIQKRTSPTAARAAVRAWVDRLPGMAYADLLDGKSTP
ncbi:MAG: serine hydroxymethyltransferase [Anaerolineae bacterium]|nr:serine hydroxymethyltransferase [Anaerolineae bacterium]